MKKSVVTLLRTTAVVLTALCVTARCRPAQQVAAADAVDPVVQHDEPAPLSFGAAAAAADDDDDRGKRQLSTVQSRLLNFLKVSAESLQPASANPVRAFRRETLAS